VKCFSFFGALLALIPVSPSFANVSAFTCTTFSYGDSSWPVTTTGINNQRQIIGYATDAQGRAHGFLRNADGSTAAIDDPATTGLIATYPKDINNLGQIAGNYHMPDGPHGFLRNQDGTFTELPTPPLFPPQPGVEPILNSFEVTGINDKGLVSGVYTQRFRSGPNVFPDRYVYVFTWSVDSGYKIVDANYATIDNQGPLAARTNNAGYVLEVGGINWDAYLLPPSGTRTAISFPGVPGYSHYGRQYVYANTVALTNGVTDADVVTAGTFLPVNSGFVRKPGGYVQAVACPDDVQAKVAITGVNDALAVSGTFTASASSDPSAPAPVQQGLLAEVTAATPGLHVSNDWWDFGTSPIGEPSCHKARIYLSNSGEADLTIQAIYFGNTVESAPLPPYAITDTNCAAPTGNPAFPFAKRKLQSGDWCYIDFNYTPTLGGSQPGQLIILDDSPQSPHLVRLSGSGVAAKLQYSNTSWDFGVQPVGRTTGPGIIYIYNPSPAPVIFRSISATGGQQFPIPEFIAYEGTCSTLAPYTTCAIQFVFTPSTTGERYGAIHLQSNADPNDMVIPLQGYAIAPQVW
jgi:probable HAF family extracellular repeat protein